MWHNIITTLIGFCIGICWKFSNVRGREGYVRPECDFCFARCAVFVGDFLRGVLRYAEGMIRIILRYFRVSFIADTCASAFISFHLLIFEATGFRRRLRFVSTRVFELITFRVEFFLFL